jgi:hypothetical protein
MNAPALGRTSRFRRAFSRSDLLALLACAGVLGAASLVMASKPSFRAWPWRSAENLRAIGAAMGQYRNDNAQYFPIVPTTRGRGQLPMQGWCGWSFGGKNNSAFWVGYNGGVFDVEAADRPLNPYLGYQLTAPPPPATLPANDPRRTTDQAPIFRDPADTFTVQRQWPTPTPGVSTYDDIGTSYLTNMSGWDQSLSQWPWNITSFFQRFNTGTQFMAQGRFLRPSQFVIAYDALAELPLLAGRSTVNWYGDTDRGLMLFYDGSVRYEPLQRGQPNTARYRLGFDPSL